MAESDARFVHVPVLLREVVEWLMPGLDVHPVLLDCTLGGAGHANAFLEAQPAVRLIGIDRDPAAITHATSFLRQYAGRVTVVKANFAEAPDVLTELQVEAIGAFLYDLGVSSPQLDVPDRGFRYRGDAPLDMRMDPEDETSAKDVVNDYTEMQLAQIIGRYGEERFARRIAKAIVRRRKIAPFLRVEDLAQVVKDAIPAATRRTGPHPARRTFQALRIEVNEELKSLERGLPATIDALVPGGRGAVISYHSLEDRIVKTVFNDFARGCTCPSDLPMCVCGRHAVVRVLTRKPIRPSEHEVDVNPRSDSARLRVIQKLEAA